MGCAAARIISRTSAKLRSRHPSACKLQETWDIEHWIWCRFACPRTHATRRHPSILSRGLGCRRVAWVLGQAKRHQIQCSISHVSCDKRVSYKGANLKLWSSPMFLVGLFKNSKKVLQKWPKTGSKSITPLGTYSIIPRSVLKTENRTSK